MLLLKLIIPNFCLAGCTFMFLKEENKLLSAAPKSFRLPDFPAKATYFYSPLLDYREIF